MVAHIWRTFGLDFPGKGRTEKLKRGGGTKGGGLNIDKNEFFIKILNKISEKGGGGAAKDRRP